MVGACGHTTKKPPFTIYLLEYLGMNKPYVDNPKYFIKKKSWFLVAWWIGYKWKELHWDYEYVRNREEWEKLLNDLKKSEWTTKKKF